MTEPWELARPWARALLAALLVVSLGLRLWYAAPRPDSSRTYDERFPFRNVTALLRDGSLAPRTAWYPSLSYLPQAAVLAASEGLHRLTGIEALSIYGPTADGYSPTAYRLARGCVAVFGMLGLLATYVAGRRLFSPAVGLLAAALLAAFPRHLLSSGHFKPDILGVLLTTLTFCWTITALRRPSLRRFLGVGAGVGLAVSAKYTGIASALPLAAGVLFRAAREGRRGWRQVGWLVLAGLLAVLVFLALNPYVLLVFRFVGKLVHGYARRGEAAGTGHLAVLRQQAELLLAGHGWVGCALLALGTAGLLAQALRRETPEAQRTDAVLVLGGFLGYSALHAGFMTFFRAQNYLPALPFSSLIAAWAGVELWRALARRLPARAARPATAAAAAVAALVLVGWQAEWVYLERLPTTWDVAEELLRAELTPVALRHVVYEPGATEQRLILTDDQGDRGLATEAASLARLDPALLDGSDAEVFPRSRLLGPAGDFYLRRGLAAGRAGLRIVEPRRWASHGEPLVIYLHPWRLKGPPTELPVLNVRRGRIAPLPAAGPGPAPAGGPAPAVAAPAGPAGTTAPAPACSLILWIPAAERGTIPALLLRPGQVRLPLVFTAQRQRRTRLATARFPAPAAPSRIELPRGPGASPPAAYRLLLYRWASPWARPAAPPR